MRIFWKSYGLIFFFISLGNLINLTHNHTQTYQYYQILIQFQLKAIFIYIAALVACFMTILASLIVLCFAFDKPFKILKLPVLLILRLLADLAGHHFEFQRIFAGFHQSFNYGFSVLVILTAAYIPSYLAHWKYVKQKN